LPCPPGLVAVDAQLELRPVLPSETYEANTLNRKSRLG
jgi:hypothetical protein